jgi:hypothetical protein
VKLGAKFRPENDYEDTVFSRSQRKCSTRHRPCQPETTSNPASHREKAWNSLGSRFGELATCGLLEVSGTLEICRHN